MGLITHTALFIKLVLVTSIMLVSVKLCGFKLEMGCSVLMEAENAIATMACGIIAPISRANLWCSWDVEFCTEVNPGA